MKSTKNIIYSSTMLIVICITIGIIQQLAIPYLNEILSFIQALTILSLFVYQLSYSFIIRIKKKQFLEDLKMSIKQKHNSPIQISR